MAVIEPIRGALRSWFQEHSDFVKHLVYDFVVLLLLLIALSTGHFCIGLFGNSLDQETLRYMDWVHSRGYLAAYLLFVVAFLWRVSIFLFRRGGRPTRRRVAVLTVNPRGVRSK